MAIVFLLYAAALAFAAWNVWRPIHASARLTAFSFGLALISGLFSLHIVAENIVVGLLFLWAGAIEGLAGLLAAMLYLAALLSLLVFHFRSYTTVEVVEASLKRGLGDEYRQRIDADLSISFPEGLDVLRILKPLPQDLPGVEIIKDIAYTPDGDIRALDIYRKHEHGHNRPVLLQIHGGAWTEKMGSKNEQARPLLNHMALRDWICVSVGYRLSPGATMPEHVIDVKDALIWVKDNIGEYGGDPDFIIATGGSTGGHLCALLTLTPGDPLFQPEALGRDTSVQGCVPFYGVLDLMNDTGTHVDFEAFLADSVIKVPRQEDPELWNAVSPLRRVHEHAPPFYVICGDTDNLVPVETNALFARKLAEVSRGSVCYAEIPGAAHAFDLIRTPHSEHVLHGIERWLAYQYSRHRAAGKADVETPVESSLKTKA